MFKGYFKVNGFSVAVDDDDDHDARISKEYDLCKCSKRHCLDWMYGWMTGLMMVVCPCTYFSIQLMFLVAIGRAIILK